MHIVVLGGGGAMGRIAVRALAEDARVTAVTVADWRVAAAERPVDWLHDGRDKARAAPCDVRDAERLAPLLAGADAVLTATDYPFNPHVLRAPFAAPVPSPAPAPLFHIPPLP